MAGSLRFSQVGRSQLTAIEVDGETIELPLIRLGRTTRSMFIACFNEMILGETAAMLADLGAAIFQDALATENPPSQDTAGAAGLFER